MAADPGSGNTSMSLKQTLGACIILDLGGKPGDVDILDRLFKYIGYRVDIHKSVVNLQQTLKGAVKPNDNSAIVIAIDQCKSDCTADTSACVINKHSDVFNDIADLNGKAKIFINHTICRKGQSIKKPVDDSLRVCSQILGLDTNVLSLFVTTLDTIFRQHANECDIHELLTKVLRDVEIYQHIEKQKRKQQHQPLLETYYLKRESEIPYHRITFQTSLKTPFRFKGSLGILDGQNRSDFVISGIEKDNILHKPRQRLDVCDGGTITINQAHEKSFDITCVMMRLQYCKAVRFRCKGQVEHVQVSYGFAEFKPNSSGVKELEANIDGEGCIYYVIIRNNQGGNNAKWNLEYKAGNPSSINVTTLLQTQMYTAPSQCSFRIKPRAHSEFNLTSVEFEARDAESVLFIWDKYEVKPNNLKDWVTIDFPKDKIPEYEIQELQITARGSSSKDVELKRPRVNDSVSEGSLPGQPMSQWVKTVNNFRQKQQGRNVLTECTYHVVHTTSRPFQLKSLSIKARNVDLMTFMWGCAEINLTLTRRWKKISFPQCEIPDRPITELRIDVHSSLDFIDLKGLRFTGEINGSKVNFDGKDTSKITITREDHNELIHLDKILAEKEEFVVFQNGKSFMVYGKRMRWFRLKSFTMKTRHCFEVHFKFIAGSKEIKLFQVRLTETDRWRDLEFPTKEIPLSSLTELVVKIKTATEGHVKDLRLTASLEGNDIQDVRVPLPNDTIPSIDSEFCLSPGRYSGLDRISTEVLKKVCLFDKCRFELRTTTLSKNKYHMNRIPRGLCVIINMSNDRPGSLVDEVKMKQLFEELYFEIRIIHNRSHKEIEDELTHLVSTITGQHQCLIVFMMGHGSSKNRQHCFSDVNQTKRPSEYIIEIFTNRETLIGIPKVFIRQTCFGGGTMSVHSESIVDENEQDKATPLDPGLNETRTAVNKYSDTVKINATLEDYMSYRKALEGSLLIQALDKTFREHAKDKDIAHLMIATNREVIKLGHELNAIQQPNAEHNTLNSNLYFHPGYSEIQQTALPDNINEHNIIPTNGKLVWQGSHNIAVLTRAGQNSIALFDMCTRQQNIYSPNNPDDILEIVSGVSVRSQYEHIIVVKRHDDSCESVHVTLERGMWTQLSKLDIDHPIATCRIDNDGIAVLSANIGNDDGTIHVYSCDDITNNKNTCMLSMDDERAGKTMSATRTIGLSKECGSIHFNINDKICYSNMKFYICCSDTSFVYQVNIDGTINCKIGSLALSSNLKQPGSLYKPCEIFATPAENGMKIIIACYDGIQQAILPQQDSNTGRAQWLNVIPLVEVYGMLYNKDMVLIIKDDIEEKIMARPKKLGRNTKADFAVVAAIDFGTTYSGYAFSYTATPTDIKTNTWGSSVGTTTYKTPTCVLTDNNDTFLDFGYGALTRYAENIKSVHKYQLYDRFKMQLFNERVLDKTTQMTSRSYRVLSAQTIIAMSLTYLSDLIITALAESCVSNIEKTRQIRWVLTVPAIWSDSAKQFMRRAALMAGMIDTLGSQSLILALEPEASSFWCRQLTIDQFIGEDVNTGTLRLDKSTIYMVVDCGGGTIDIALHQLLEDNSVREVHRATGGSWGGTTVDDRFIGLLIDILGADFISQYKHDYPQDWLTLIIRFETKKRSYDPIKGASINLPITYQLGTAVRKLKHEGIESIVEKAKKPGISCNKGHLVLEKEVIEQMFTHSISNIVKHIKYLLRKQVKLKIDYMFVVGGYGDCNFLQQKLKKEFSNKLKILIPTEPGMAIMRGAVIYGHNPEVVVSRKARKTYGEGLMMPFRGREHDPRKRITVNGEEMCKNLFHVWIDKNETVKTGDRRTFTSTPYSAQTTAAIKYIYSSYNYAKNITYVTDQGVDKIGELAITIPDSQFDRNIRQIKTHVYFGTEITVRLEDGLRGEDGDYAEQNIDFLSERILSYKSA